MLSADTLSSMASLNDPAYVKFYPKLIKELSENLTSDELVALTDTLMDDHFETQKKLTADSFSHALLRAVLSPFSMLKRDGTIKSMQLAVLNQLYTSFLAAQDEGKYPREEFIDVLAEFVEIDPILNATLMNITLTENEDVPLTLSDEAKAKIANLYAPWHSVFSSRNDIDQMNVALDEMLLGASSEAAKMKQRSLIDKAKEALESVKKNIDKKSEKKASEGKNIEDPAFFNALLIKKLAEKFSSDKLKDIASAFLIRDDQYTACHFAHALISAILNPMSSLIRDAHQTAVMQELLLGPLYAQYLAEGGHPNHVSFQKCLNMELSPRLRVVLRQIDFLEEEVFEADWPEVSDELLIDFAKTYQDWLQQSLLLQARVNELSAIWQHCADAFENSSARSNQYLEIKAEINAAFKSVLEDEGDLADLIAAANQKITEVMSAHLNVSVAGQTPLQRLEKLKLPNFAALEKRLRSESGFKVEDVPAIAPIPEVSVSRVLSAAPARAKSLLMNRASPARQPSAPKADPALLALQTRIKELNEIWQSFAKQFEDRSKAQKKYTDLIKDLNGVLKDVSDVTAANEEITEIIKPHLTGRVKGMTPLECLEKQKLPKDRLEIELGLKKEIGEEVVPVKQEKGMLAKLLEVPKTFIRGFSPARSVSAVPKEDPKTHVTSIPSL